MISADRKSTARSCTKLALLIALLLVKIAAFAMTKR